jgi:hypothetical protein
MLLKKECHYPGNEVRTIISCEIGGRSARLSGCLQAANKNGTVPRASSTGAQFLAVQNIGHCAMLPVQQDGAVSNDETYISVSNRMGSP